MPERTTIEKIKKIVELSREGVSCPDIVRETGVSKQTVHVYRRKFGIS
jgi:DNA-binding NarL/FixJ family response regulator